MILICITVFLCLSGFVVHSVLKNAATKNNPVKVRTANQESNKPRDIKLDDYFEEDGSSYDTVSTASKLVVIDPGHGGDDPGTRSADGMLEKNIALDTCLKLNSILTHWGIETYMIRTTDIFIPYTDRISTANSKKASLYLSVHCDWFKDTSYKGTATLFYPSQTLALGHLTEVNYATIIQNELVKTIGLNNRGINDRPDLAVLHHAKMPSVLVELGFLSNPDDTTQLSSEEFRQNAAQGLALGIKAALAKISDP